MEWTMVSDWACAETASADFGDERLNRRFALIVSTLGNRPNLSIPAGCRGHAEMTATYRFTDNDRVTLDKILESHGRCTLARAAEHPVALFVQDTTELDLSRPEQQVVGAGGLDGSCRRGIFAHVVHVFTDDGTPLGTSSARIINRPDCTEEHKDKRRKTKAQKEKERTAKPIEQKESMRWLDGLRSVREAVMATPALYTVSVLIRGRTAKMGMETGGRRQARDSRQATLEVRAASVTLIAQLGGYIRR